MSVYGYLRDLDTPDDDFAQGGKLDFDWQPTDLSTDHDSGMKSIATPGRSHPIQQWGGGGDWEEHLKLTFVGNDANPIYATERANWLLSRTFPSYDGNGNLLRGPATMLYVIGQWKNLRCTIAKVKATPGATFDKDTRYPRVMIADITLRVSTPSAIDYTAVGP